MWAFRKKKLRCEADLNCPRVVCLIPPPDWLSAPAGCSLWASVPSNLHWAAKHQLSHLSSPLLRGYGSDSWRPNKLQPGPHLPARWWLLASETCGPGQISAPHLERDTQGVRVKKDTSVCIITYQWCNYTAQHILCCTRITHHTC